MDSTPNPSAAGSISATYHPPLRLSAGLSADRPGKVPFATPARQEPMTKDHPKRVLAAAAIAATVALLAGCGGGSSTTSKVNEAMGLNASDCSFVGRMLLGGTSEKVFQCTSDSQATVGCYAVNGDEVADVSKTFQSLIALQNQQVDCGQ